MEYPFYFSNLAHWKWNGKHFIKISAMQVKFQEIKLKVHTEIASTWKYFAFFRKRKNTSLLSDVFKIAVKLNRWGRKKIF